MYCSTGYCAVVSLLVVQCGMSEQTGHFGDNINSTVLSFIQRGCPLLGGSQCMESIVNDSFWDLDQRYNKIRSIMVSLPQSVLY